MLGTYQTCQQIAKTHRCANCDTRSVLLVRHRPAADGVAPCRWEVYCPGCQEREKFVKPESLTARWKRDPGSVNVAVANRLARRYESEIESVAEGLPPDLAEAVKRHYLPDTADTKEK
jgi:hypothetical protein